MVGLMPGGAGRLLNLTWRRGLAGLSVVWPYWCVGVIGTHAAGAPADRRASASSNQGRNLCPAFKMNVIGSVNQARPTCCSWPGARYLGPKQRRW